MVTYDIIEPWPSTYRTVDQNLEARKLISKVSGRQAAAMRVGIPPLTIEPPQIHLVCSRDGKPFEELLTGLDGELAVVYYDIQTKKRDTKIYQPGQDIVIPLHRIHWLANPHNQEVQFTCEYAPHPWDGEGDEPEFQNLETLLRFVEDKRLMQRVIQAR
ncbi:Uncharacterised protein [uncultured archaeon]|nr:Uncharacterised protein [uncultured archaeon]